MKRISLIFFAVLFALTSVSNCNAQVKRNFLCGKNGNAELKNILKEHATFHPFPKINERDEWLKVPENIRNEYIHNGEKYLNKPWETLPASVFLDYKRNGNRSRYEDICFKRRQKLMSLVFAEIFENKGRFLDDIANGIWLVCEETFWGIPAHVGAQTKGTDLPDVTDPIIDLFSAETAAMLAYIDYLMEDKLKEVSPLIPERIYYEENRRIFSVYKEKSAWWKTGTNNWNPWINSNVLASLLLLEKDNARRNDLIFLTMQSVDVFINSYPEDGGCDEGPNYWSRAAGSLFDYLELLYTASDGKINLYNEPLIKKMGQFIYKTWIGGNYFINFADASALSYPDPILVFRFGNRINDPLMSGFGAWLAARASTGVKIAIPDFGSPISILPNLFLIDKIVNAKQVEPYTAETWLPDLQVMAARSFSNSEKEFYIAAKGGHNAESHNHNDVGNFIVYCNGKPVLIDVGVETYTAKTFSSKRYEIWTMQSQYHNLPTINGIQQKDGRNFHAENVKFLSSKDKTDFSLELAKCYPDEAGINSWFRNIELIKGKKVILTDKYDLKERKGTTTLNLMTCLTADCSLPGKIILIGTDSSKYEIVYDKNKFTAAAENITIDDARLMPVWGKKLTRIVLTITDSKLKDSYKIEVGEIN